MWSWIYETAAGCSQSCSDQMPPHVVRAGFKGALSLPRQLSYDAASRSLRAYPVAESALLRAAQVCVGCVLSQLLSQRCCWWWRCCCCSCCLFSLYCMCCMAPFPTLPVCRCTLHAAAPCQRHTLLQYWCRCYGFQRLPDSAKSSSHGHGSLRCSCRPTLRWQRGLLPLLNPCAHSRPAVQLLLTLLLLLLPLP